MRFLYEKIFVENRGGIFYSSELGRVALERCKTAREAIKLMGELIDEYGLYGTAEALFVADREEGWLFEMQPIPSGKGGLWIAERIPDGHFSIAANQLRIRAIREGDSNQIFNPKLPQMLKELGWADYDAQGNLDLVKSLQGGEFYPYYSMRRVWRGLSMFAPSLKLSTNKSLENPFIPFAVAQMPAAYNSALRDEYDDSKMFWASSQVMALSRGYWNSLGETVEKAVEQSEKKFSEVGQVVAQTLQRKICRAIESKCAESLRRLEKSLRGTFNSI